MLHWNFFKPQQRWRQLWSVLSLASPSSTARPRILTLWLLCSVLWLLLVCVLLTFLYWYHDKQWLLQHKFGLILVLLAGLVLCIVAPVFWRIFVVLDGQERTPRLIERSTYQRLTPIQARLAAFAAHVQQKYPLPWLNRHYILAVQGDPQAFSDVAEQLVRVGWVKVDQVYLVLMNELDDIDSIPAWRGQYHSPFDGVVLLRDLEQGTSTVHGDTPQVWLQKFYGLIGWQVPFAHVFQCSESLYEVTENLSWCARSGAEAVSRLKQKVYQHLSGWFLRQPQMQLLSVLTTVDDAGMELAEHYAPAQLNYCKAIGVQAKQSRWWGQWVNVAIELHQYRPQPLTVPTRLKLAKMWLVLLVGMLVWIGVAFGRNLHEIDLFRHEFSQLQQIQTQTAAVAPIMQLQNHMISRQQLSLTTLLQLGFNYDQALLTKALPLYGAATKRWLVMPADAQIQTVLQALPEQKINLMDMRTQPNAGSETMQNSHDMALDEGFDALKAYLMLRYPKRVDNIYLTDYLSRVYRYQRAANASWIQQIFEFYTQQMSQHKSWFLPLDETLVRQSRAVLNELYQQQQQDTQLYQALLQTAAERFKPLTLADLAGKESQQFWQNKEMLPGAYTAKAWREWFEPELNKLNPAHYKNGSWVLNAAGVDDEQDDIRKQIMALYQQDYFQHWLKFLAAIEWVADNHLHSQVERLKQYADKKNSVLVKLLAAIEANTQVGYAANRTRQGKGVLTEFEPIVALIEVNQDKAGTAKRPLDQYQENLLTMYLQLQKIQGAKNQAAASQLAFNALSGDAAGASTDFAKVQQAIDLQVANLGMQWQDIGATLLTFPFDDAKKVALQPALLNINQLWQQQVLLAWQQRFASKYPLDKHGQQDVSLTELQQFIDPHTGVIAQFNRQYLGDILLLVGNQWQLKPAVSDEIAVDPMFVSQLNELNQLLEFVVTAKDTQHGTASFELKMTPMPDIKHIGVLAAGQKWQYFNEKSYWHKVNWPLNADTDKKSAIEWVDLDDQHGRLEVMGDLSILHLLDKATVATLNGDGSYHLQWQIEGKKINMDIKSLQTNDFITLLKLKGFDFPKTVFKVTADAE